MPHLSFSQLTTLWGCPEKHRRTYVLGEREAPSPAIIIGQAAHAGIEAVLRSYQEKRPSGGKAAIEQQVATKYHSLKGAVKSWIDGRSTLSQEDGLTFATMMSATLYERAVPDVKRGSKYCEWRFDEEVPGVGPEPNGDRWTFTGSIDHVREYGRVMTIDDWKTTSGRWSQSRADASLQPDAYYWAVRRVFGRLPDKFVFHVVSRPKRVGGEWSECAYETYETTRDAGAIDLFEERMRHAIKYVRLMHEADKAGDMRTDWEYHKYCAFRGACTPWELGTLGEGVIL